MSKGLIISIVAAVIFIILIVIVWKKQSKKTEEEASSAPKTSVTDFTGRPTGNTLGHTPGSPQVGTPRGGANTPRSTTIPVSNTVTPVNIYTGTYSNSNVTPQTRS